MLRPSNNASSNCWSFCTPPVAPAVVAGAGLVTKQRGMQRFVSQRLVTLGLALSVALTACGHNSSTSATSTGASTSALKTTVSTAAVTPSLFPAPTDAPTKLLMARLAALSADSMEGRLAGSPGGARARGWLIRELRALGVAPIGTSYEQPVKITRRTPTADSMGANVIARIPGKNPNAPAIVLSAHYDHLGVRNGDVFNGADDDASGCIAVLTIAEHVKKAGLEHDLVIAFFDGEESGLLGAKAFVASPSVPLNRMAIDLSLDMVSRQDGGALWVAGLSHYPFLRDIVVPVAAQSRVKIHLGHDTKDLKPGDDWTNSSDHGAFHSKGIPFLYLGVEDHPDYHKAGDEVGKIDPVFYRGVVDFSEQLVRAVDRAVSTFPSRG
ncbi:MAG: M28 family peptidase [Gemmatimonas sp.]